MIRRTKLWIYGFSSRCNSMNKISEYIKTVGGIQSEQRNFYYGPGGIDKVVRTQGEVQNLTMDFSTDSNGIYSQ